MGKNYLSGGIICPPGLKCSALSFILFIRLFFIFILIPMMPGNLWALSENCLYLVIKHQNNTVLRIPARENQIFIVKYIHSVALTPVEDFFKIQNKKILLEKTLYRDFGAGLPHSLDEGQKMTIEGGKISVAGYKQIFDKLDMRVGRIANHTLILLPPLSSSQIPPLLDLPLNYLSSPGSALTFSIEN